MKRIKTINKLLSSLTLLSPLAGIGFNNQYQNTQNVITENYNNSLNNYFSSNEQRQRQMGDITVTVEGTTITDYVSGTGDLVVDSDITEIGNSAFSLKTEITSLDLSHVRNLTTIHEAAFQECRHLIGNLTIPSSVTNIEDMAFRFTNITSLDLSQTTSLTNIGAAAFFSCSNLTGDLVIPSSVTSIKNDAFGCTSITSLDLSNATSLTSIAQSTFESCTNLTGDLIVPSSVTSISGAAFAKTSIISLDLSNATSLTTIGPDAFVETDITSLDLSQATSLTSIGRQAFADCLNLTGDLTIPSSVTSIGQATFKNSSINNLYFLSESPPTFSSDWQPTLTDKVYVPTNTKNSYLSQQNFGFPEEKSEEWSYDPNKESLTGDFSPIELKSTESGQTTEVFKFNGFNPEFMSENATWTLIPTNEIKEIPQGLSISNGIISWNNVPEGLYTFKISASLADHTVQSQEEIQLWSVQIQPIINGNNNIYALKEKAGSEQYNANSELKANQWEIIMSKGEKPDDY